MQVYFCFQLCKCRSCSVGPSVLVHLSQRLSPRKCKGNMAKCIRWAWKKPGWSFLSLPSVKICQEKASCLWQIFMGCGFMWFKQQFASGRTGDCWCFWVQNPKHTHSSIKCFSLSRKAVGISNLWNLHLILPYVWAQTEPPQVEVSPGLRPLLTDGLAMRTGIIFFSF